MKELLTSIPVWLGALLIFSARVISVTMDTLRFMMTMRGKRLYAWILGFIESALFVLIIGSVLANMNNIFNVLAYAAGFATGNVIGITLEKRLAVGFAHIKAISQDRGREVADALREKDYAVTEIAARGMDGEVILLDINLKRKNIKDVEDLIKEVDPSAFITVEDVTPVRRGYWH